jgi:hypothetical protein
MEEFNVLNEKTWCLATENDFVWKDNTCFNIENNQRICEKEMVALLRQLFDILESGVTKKQTEEYGRDKIVAYMLDSLFAKAAPDDIPCEVVVIIKMGIDPAIAHTVYQSMKKKNKENKTSNTNEVKNIITAQKRENNTKPEIRYRPITDNSKPGLFLILGIIFAIITLFIFRNTINSSDLIVSGGIDNTVASLILNLGVLSIAFIFFGLYSKEKNKKAYYDVCISMGYWLGRVSDDLVKSWGTPSKTSKFSQDKSVSIWEYKDSIRNHTGYSTRTYYKGFSTGFHTGQSRTTKYTKTFYIKDGYIIDYKYTIQ